MAIDRVKLSPQEAVVVASLLDGELLPDIAKKYGMSNTNVRNCASRAYAKCGARTAHQLVVKYYSRSVEFTTGEGKFV